MTSSLAAVVMAAGLGTRMRSERPKHLHPLLGRRLLDWSIAPVLPLGPDPLVVVCSPRTKNELDGTLPAGATLAVQAEPKGTGDAVAAAHPALAGFGGDVFVLDGAAPLLTTELLKALLDAHREADASVTVLSIEPDEPLPYGRIIRDENGALRAIVEEKDATPEDASLPSIVPLWPQWVSASTRRRSWRRPKPFCAGAVPKRDRGVRPALQGECSSCASGG
jgi:bifunctional UDP-N-acetylglucosamine pyrophosphorylase/glucosamine-1-phosphate N-acetyltransferase